MRYPDAATSIFAAAMLVALASCGGGAPPPPPVPAEPPAPAASRPEAPAAAPVDAGGGAQAKVASGVPALDTDLVVSTNEPFWNATIGGQAVVLRGPDVTRHLVVGSSDSGSGTRSVQATDGSGQVEVKVVVATCRDSMSGAEFPFSATLAIDGGSAVEGCARPASMPPPGEPR